MSSEPRPPRTIFPAFVRRSLWALGLLYVAYLVAGNIYLNSPAIWRVVNRRPEAFEAHWAHAETWWPGYMRASQVRLRGQARQWLWAAEGESASGRILLWPLLRREIRFETVDTSEITVVVQSAASDLKPLPGSAEAWWVTAERIETTSLRKLQWDELLLSGKATAVVGFTHQLRGGITRVLPSDIRARHATLSYGTHWRSQDSTLDLHFATDAFTHEQPPGWHKLERATFHLTFDGSTPPLNLGVTPAANRAKGAPSSREGHLVTDLTLDHGVLREGGSAHWQGMVETTDGGGLSQQKPGSADLLVKANAIDGHLSVPAIDPATPRLADHFDLAMSFASQRLLPMRTSGETLRLLSGSAVAHWHFASLSWLMPLMSKKPWLQWDGAGEMDAALSIDHGRLLPGSRLDIPKLGLVANVLGNRFSGTASAKGRVVADSSGARSSMSMAMHTFVLSPGATPNQPYLRGTDMQVDLRSSDDLAKFRDTVLARIKFDNAEVPDLQAYNHYLPGKSLYFVHGRGNLSTDLNIDGEGDVSAGRMQMHTRGAALALGSSQLTGNLNLDTRLAVARHSGRAFELRDFTLSMDGVQMDGANDPSWWTTITLEQGRLDWDRPMQLDGQASMRMKNVSVLLALFAKRSAFPAWIGHIVDDGEARVTSTVRARRGEFILDNVRASNERIQLLARLRIADGKPTGDVYARWGILSVGVALANDQRQFHWVNAAAWYQAQPPLLPVAEVASP